jgi:hypothetical protein
MKVFSKIGRELPLTTGVNNKQVTFILKPDEPIDIPDDIATKLNKRLVGVWEETPVEDLTLENPEETIETPDEKVPEGDFEDNYTEESKDTEYTSPYTDEEKYPKAELIRLAKEKGKNFSNAAKRETIIAFLEEG